MDKKPHLNAPQSSENAVTIDTKSQITLPLSGTLLLGDDGKASVGVIFHNPTVATLSGPVPAAIADIPKPTPTAITAVVTVPPAFTKPGTTIELTVTTKDGSSNSINYVVETPEQTVRRVLQQNQAQAAVVAEALHAQETPQQAIDRISTSLPDKDRAILATAFQQALKQGFELSTPNVHNNVSVHAVLLPYDICKAIFGNEIARRYTAVEVIVSNRTDDAALIVQNIYINYLEWKLAGGLGRSFTNELNGYEAGTDKGHIASLESRIVRGDLLDASAWSLRNTTIRALQLAGTLAAGYQFSIKEKGLLKGIGAFNGQVIPGAEAFWPDGSTAQANRISDFGFQVNKVVAKQSAELIVAFYPVSRFLTPGLQAIFRKAPALLFAPTSVAFDDKAFELLRQYAPAALSVEERALIQNYLKGHDNVNGDGQRLNNFLNEFSLNHVQVVVSGVMAVDLATIPPSIEEIVMDGGNTAATWAVAGLKTATVNGKYLTGSSVTILNGATYGITDAAAVTTGSSDTALKIQFTLSKPLPADTVLTVTLSKTATIDSQKKTLTSNPYLLRVTYNPPQPKITGVTTDGKKVTIAGNDFYNVNSTLAVTLHPTIAKGLMDVGVPNDALVVQPAEIDIDLTKLTLQPACWTPNVSISSLPVPGASAFAQPPKPTLVGATVNGNQVVVTGTGFLDLSECKSKLEFQVQNGTAAAEPVKNLKIDSLTQATFDAPDLSSGTWNVLVLVDGKQQATTSIPRPAAANPPARAAQSRTNAPNRPAQPPAPAATPNAPAATPKAPAATPNPPAPQKK